MKCPHCQHTSNDTALLHCTQCGEAYERGPFEEFQHLEYLTEWLKDRAEISASQRKELTSVAEKKKDKLLAQLLPKPVEKEEIETKPVLEEAQASPTPAVTPIPEPSPSLSPVSPTPAPPVGTKPVVAPAPTPVSQPKPVAPPKPVSPPKPTAPPKPKRPPVDWKKVREQLADAVTSGALLRALLYLGAFMIVISATVLVIRFWNQFNPILQMVFIASVPLMFYSGGWLLRSRLKLEQGGTVLTGIGAVLVAVDFAAIYQFGGLAERVNGPAYWLGVSIFCTAVYTFTAWKVKGEFFDYLTLISGACVLVALTRILKPAPALEWTVVIVTFSGTVMTWLAGRLWKASDAWHGFARASRYLSQILIPASVFYLLFSLANLPIMCALLLALIGYTVLAWKFPSIVFAYSALIASIGAVIFGLRGADVQPEWYALTASVLALVYILIGQSIQKVRIEANVIRNYVKALNTTGLILVGLAAVSGFVIAFGEVWAGVLAMTVATLDFIICAYLFKHSRYTLFASGLFIAPFTFAFWRWFTDATITHPLGWMTAAWLGLALAYLGLGVFLRKVEGHARWLYALAHGLTLFTLGVLPLEYSLSAKDWSYIPTSTALGLSILVYLLSIILHDRGKHPALSNLVNWIPLGLGKSIFVWFAGLLFPIWIAVGWYGNQLNSIWFGALFAGFGFGYIGIGQWLTKRTVEYRLPLHTYAYFLLAIGILIAIPDPYSALVSDRYPLLFALTITFASLGLLAYIYNRVAETTLASALFIWLFILSLEMLNVPQRAYGFAFVLLASLIYVPIGIYLNKPKAFESTDLLAKIPLNLHAIPVFVTGYALSIYAIYNSIVWSFTDASIPWVGVTVPLIAAILYVFSTSYFKENILSNIFAWTSVVTFTVTFRQALNFFHSPVYYDAFAWVAFAAFYMIVERILNHVILSRASQTESAAKKTLWFNKFRLPLVTGWIILAGLGLYLTLPSTLAAFRGSKLITYTPFIIAQATLVLLLIASARTYRTRLPLFIEPAISFLPTTLFFIGFGESIFGKALTTPQFALAWTGLGIVHILAAIFTDHTKERYSYGLYLGGYVLLTWAVAWSVIERSTLVWSFGLWILASIISALLVHFGKHQTWTEFIDLLFRKTQTGPRTFSRNLFQWLAAWTFPIWTVILLREMNIPDSYSWLGLIVPPLAYLGLALWTLRFDPAYASPLYSAAQFFTVIGLLITIPDAVNFLFNYILPYNGKVTLLAFILIQSIGVLFYIFAAWMWKSRFFAHIATWLSIVAFSMAWQGYGVELTPIILIVPWLIWSATLFLIGYTLDKNEVRYSHGPYLGGYALMIYALGISTAVRLTNIYALAITIALAIASYLVVHFGRHHTFEDFITTFFKKVNDTTRQIASTIFLFYAAYALPVLLTQYLAYIKLDLAWRGIALAIAAPLYIAVSLLIRNAKSRGIATVPTWATYSAGYALTAIGAMVSFGNEQLAIYVLTLDAIVYAVSAYIFKQSFWLYLTTVLTPIVTLLTLHYNDRLETNLVTWIFMAFAFLYLAIGQIFDTREKSGDVHPFAAPFYAPGFILSAVALALASSERMLAIQVYSAGVVLYSLSGFLFRESLFIYPAAWLAAVPYYLAVTLTSLETRWYGLAWLPLIIVYIAVGKIFFHKEKLAPIGKGMLAQWLTHPAVPFYLLAYALSISMVSLSYASPLPLTVAFGTATVIYFASAYLFKKPAWTYPALFTVHMTVLAYFTISPSGNPMRYITLPFLAMTWLTSLVGYAFERTTILTDENKSFRFSLLNRLFGYAWARPFFAFAIFEMILWQSLALTGTDTTIIVGSGYALLFALFSLLWTEGMLVYGAVAFGLLAVGGSLKQAEVQLADAVAVYGGIGFGLYLLGRILDWLSARVKSLTVWLTPLTHSSIALTALAILINLPTVTSHMTATAATFAFAGALYVAIAYRGRMYRLGYLGMALLELAWVLALIINDVAQPQWYAIPGGLYFIGLGYLEWRLKKSKYAVALEILGLGLLLVTSFAQSLDGETGLPYFALLLVEGLIVIWWGVYQKRKIPFFTGIGASAINFIAQVIILISVYDINRWLVGFVAGLLIMTVAIYIERSRERLRERARELSETLEKWE